jgi:hypothetical protein
MRNIQRLDMRGLGGDKNWEVAITLMEVMRSFSRKRMCSYSLEVTSTQKAFEVWPLGYRINIDGPSVCHLLKFNLFLDQDSLFSSLFPKGYPVTPNSKRDDPLFGLPESTLKCRQKCTSVCFLLHKAVICLLVSIRNLCFLNPFCLLTSQFQNSPFPPPHSGLQTLCGGD